MKPEKHLPTLRRPRVLKITPSIFGGKKITDLMDLDGFVSFLEAGNCKYLAHSESCEVPST